MQHPYEPLEILNDHFCGDASNPVSMLQYIPRVYQHITHKMPAS